MDKNGTWRYRTLYAILALILLLGAAVASYFLWERAPELGVEEGLAVPAAEEPSAPPTAEMTSVMAPQERRSYTLLLVGNDDGNGNTDTILVARLDTMAHRLDIVSLPRDTYVNVSWNIRKLNAIYAGTVNAGGVGIEGLKQQVKNLLGFGVDCYAVVDLDLFIEAVDRIGGVDFDVPQDMDYDDPAQGLSIHLKAGPQHLDGRQAMGVVRYRSGYVNGDLDRVAVQQSFLKAAASQILKSGLPQLKELAVLLYENMETDLYAANIAFFLRQALLCDSENIRFATMPNIPADVAGLSYTFVDLEPWLQMINERLNPFDMVVTQENLDVVYKVPGGFGCTTGTPRGEWYLYS